MKESDKKEIFPMIEQRMCLWSLFLLFLGLKLSDKIDWSWWLVSMPIWAPALGTLVALAVFGILYLIWGE